MPSGPRACKSVLVPEQEKIGVSLLTLLFQSSGHPLQLHAHPHLPYAGWATSLHYRCATAQALDLQLGHFKFSSESLMQLVSVSMRHVTLAVTGGTASCHPSCLGHIASFFGAVAHCMAPQGLILLYYISIAVTQVLAHSSPESLLVPAGLLRWSLSLSFRQVEKHCMCSMDTKPVNKQSPVACRAISRTPEAFFNERARSELPSTSTSSSCFALERSLPYRLDVADRQNAVHTSSVHFVVKYG